jgi:hypothetical protein
MKACASHRRFNGDINIHRDWKGQVIWRWKWRSCVLFSYIKGDYSKIIRPGSPSSQICYFCGFYDDCLKRWEDIAPKFGDKGTDSCITTTHSSTPGDFMYKKAWLSFPSTTITRLLSLLFSVFLRLKMPPFRHIWVDQGGVVGCPGQSCRGRFQGRIQKYQKRWERCIRLKRNNFEAYGNQ